MKKNLNFSFHCYLRNFQITFFGKFFFFARLLGMTVRLFFVVFSVFFLLHFPLNYFSLFFITFSSFVLATHCISFIAFLDLMASKLLLIL